MFVRFENICFRYENNKDDILHNINFNIEKGDIVSILGPSGSGKSTILRLISGLEIPYIGKIFLDGKILVDDNIFIKPEKRKIGMVFQDYVLFPHLTVEKNIAFGIDKLSNKSKIVDEMLDLIDMKEYRKRYPYELSGGQQQRVAIARALAPRPNMLLLDEPFSNLDLSLKDKVRDDIKRILKESNITSVFVTHDKIDSEILSDKIIKIDRGIIHN